MCKKYKIPIQAAAIQFALKNPVVTSIVLGMDEFKQVKENLKFLDYKINDYFWKELDLVS